MKKVEIMSIAVFIVTLLIMGINMFIRPLSDWLVRVDGIVMLISAAVVVYMAVQSHNDFSCFLPEAGRISAE